MIAKFLAAAVAISTTMTQTQAQTQTPVQVTAYKGLCEASAGVFIDANHFVVASDESNKLQLYRRGSADPIGQGIDMQPFTTFDKSDLEAAALVGDRVYWTSSHSFNKEGKDKTKRKIFFATRVVVQDGKPTLVSTGKPVINGLRDPLMKVAGVAANELNIEGLAATPEGHLLIGLRAPLLGKQALIVPLKNPGPVVDDGAAPDFGKAVPLDLEGRGIRSMDLVSRDPVRYIVVAGPKVDAATETFAVFSWSGPDSKPTKIDRDFGKFKPEAAMAVPGLKIVQLLSDDDDDCEDPAKRRFPSIDIAFD